MTQVLVLMLISFGVGFYYGRLSKFKAEQKAPKKRIIKCSIELHEGNDGRDVGWHAYGETGLFLAQGKSISEVREKIMKEWPNTQVKIKGID